MRFAILGSGSGGNAAVIQWQNTTLLLDCGFTIKECVHRLSALEVDPETINAIIVTHEHGDHYSGVGPLSRRFNIPVFMTHGSHHPHRCGEIPDLNLINSHRPFTIGDIEIMPFPVPHDAKEPCQYVFSTTQHRLGFLTDTGSLTPHIEHSLQQCDALVIEFNHDSEMLRNGPYPPQLQARVGGYRGHLSNQQSDEIVSRLIHPDLSHLVAAHLSERNNQYDLVMAILKRHTQQYDCTVTIASQHETSSWIEIASNESLSE